MVHPRPSTQTDVSKRTIIAAAGSLIAGGGVVAVAGSTPARAAVTGSLSIPDESAQGPGQLESLQAQVSGNYEYETNGADTIRLALDVASAPDAGDWASIDTTEHAVSTASGAGSYTLQGSVLDHPQLDAAYFSAEPEKTVTRSLPVRVVLDVLSGGRSVAAATAQSVATVEVTNTNVQASAALTGSGQVTATV